MLKYSNLQPSEMWRKPFYEIEYLVEKFKEDNEEQNKRYKEEESRYKKQQFAMKDMKGTFREMQNSFKQSTMQTPKFPDISKFKM